MPDKDKVGKGLLGVAAAAAAGGCLYETRKVMRDAYRSGKDLRPDPDNVSEDKAYEVGQQIAEYAPELADIKRGAVDTAYDATAFLSQNPEALEAFNDICEMLG